jgi:hypothetical protein
VQFRRRVLENCGIDTSSLATVDAVDAALAALTGILALEGNVSTVGDPDEGVILLPVSTLPPTKLLRLPVRSTTRAGSAPAADPLPNVSSTRLCECGCGATVRRRFLPGHDAKLKSRLRRLQRAGVAEATDRLRALGWADDVRS